ncbi:integration host factor subunit beta [Persicimonas caeni]|uniref:Integration host factor subunit beta n=1 Tax=Persicimonas caeni TaxID=2292766 RepID=A0A4Y6PU50_PERCE|nr:HU family DNA-binding protein [Persicimonas caeni]QDG51856.1 integration host factor subunit beta [Persicimonas caeni]QED33077.1 integration host factor subunit beta [Persicimonas caeni]
MTKSELIEVVAERIDIPKNRAYDVVNAIFDAMKDALLQEDRIELRGFGSFSIREYDARVGRNPRTGEEVFVDAKKSVHFKVGKELRERVDVLNEYN